MNNSNLINPYNLLGVTPSSKLNDAKKSYYNWALMCHPDKGGSEEEMIIVKNAYEYIKKQLTFVETKDGNTYEKLEEDFEKFCLEQESRPPPFSVIYEETNDWIKDFNKEFLEKKQSEDHNPFDKGYGEFMENRVTSEEYKDKENYKVEHQFNNCIIEYKEPQCLPDTHQEYPLNIKNINDFTCINNKIIMTDYKKAFSPKPKLDISLDNKTIKEKYEEQLKLRNLI